MPLRASRVNWIHASLWIVRNIYRPTEWMLCSCNKSNGPDVCRLILLVERAVNVRYDPMTLIKLQSLQSSRRPPQLIESLCVVTCGTLHSTVRWRAAATRTIQRSVINLSRTVILTSYTGELAKKQPPKSRKPYTTLTLPMGEPNPDDLRVWPNCG